MSRVSLVILDDSSGFLLAAHKLENPHLGHIVSIMYDIIIKWHYERDADNAIEFLLAGHQKEFEEFAQKLGMAREEIAAACAATKNSVIQIADEHSKVQKLDDIKAEIRRSDAGFTKKADAFHSAMVAEERELDSIFDLQL